PILTQRISQKKPENLAVTVITLEEKIKGWLNQINRSNNEPFKLDSKLLWGYKGLSFAKPNKIS
ncbi:hypothetical protein PN473_01655, partial [Dolichospermum circinale CS-545/17]|nr:hypothetical protein [Dolichospermum circinale CS-545/17]